jgi:hypothetical protein
MKTNVGDAMIMKIKMALNVCTTRNYLIIKIFGEML